PAELTFRGAAFRMHDHERALLPIVILPLFPPRESSERGLRVPVRTPKPRAGHPPTLTYASTSSNGRRIGWGQSKRSALAQLDRCATPIDDAHLPVSLAAAPDRSRYVRRKDGGVDWNVV